MGFGTYENYPLKSDIILFDTFVGMSNTYLTTANLPSNAVSVENNFVMDANGNVITTIRPERMVTGFSAATATGLKSFVGDMPNLTNGTAMFKNCTQLTTFIGDLSSLETADEMFYGCTLDAESLEILADTLPTVTSGTIDIGASTNATDEVIATIKGKDWTLKSNGTAL